MERGDRLVQIDNKPYAQIAEECYAYLGSSTKANYYWRLADNIRKNDFNLSPILNHEGISLVFEKSDGKRYEQLLFFQDKDSLSWSSERSYRGFSPQLVTNNFTAFTDPDHPKVVLLSWEGFDKKLPDDVDRLMAWAGNNGLLNADLIFDLTNSSGGTNGIYAISRLVSRPYRPILGNIRISELSPHFILMKSEFLKDQLKDSTQVAYARRAEIDNGERLLDWLQGSVKDSVKAGAPYSENVVFKMKHELKNDSIYPADQHFDSRIVLLTGPSSGSQLDQFIAILADNGFAHVIGMPSGGYSNTWEWQEALKQPGTNHSMCMFKWSVGQSIRPNGEVLEGNPVEVDEYHPLTYRNINTYEDELVERALKYLKRKK